MNYSILPKARTEFKQAFIRYENHRPGLGNEFSDEFYEALDHILSYPEAWTEIETGIRRYLTEKFPYAILYHYVEAEPKITIIAIMHTRQKPGYWQSRKF